MTEPVVLAAAEALTAVSGEDDPFDWKLEEAQYLYDQGLLTDKLIAARETSPGVVEWKINV